ncbi:Uncharacterised protein [Serratia ficaria]|uniref:hypothetical protein n=1 Tax=Serratia ficaria TaxID=61651 RepID=UPI00217C4B18|nr:hypothetical protein [Serratia ficaria]CAI1104628.1 Uncharacterised protein [Serratia ficaria]CAI1940826.1 Uncharacterised protein [Serratia ficaria]CAI2465347.1 Uncharacterised protein [Serratia ficaria]CAI2787730.1 Uncharacterised protein [Serratia ficaria]
MKEPKIYSLDSSLIPEAAPKDGFCVDLVSFADYEALKAERDAQQKRADALAVENAALNNFIATSCYVWAGEEPAWHPAIDHSPETPATNQLSIEESRFLTDAITAAGLLSCGKQDKGLARRITDFCVAKIGNSNPAKLRKETPYTAAIAAIKTQAGIEAIEEAAYSLYGKGYVFDTIMGYAAELREAK